MTFNPGKLRACPECGGKWPSDPDFALRGAGWLYGLSRSVTPSNSDVELHDGANGRNRFLRFEIKRLEERVIAKGQLQLLVGLSQLPNFTVRLLRGTTRDIEVRRIDRAGVSEGGFHTHGEALRVGVDRWLNGAPWREVEADLERKSSGASVSDFGHVHGWARVDGVWTCIQDHHAVGFRPDTGCGETLPQFT